MSTLENRPRTALVVVDMQKGVVGDAYRRDETVANIVRAVDRARQQDVPVVWVQHSDEKNLPRGSEAWEYVDELARTDGEPVVHKKYPDAFEDTDLEERLAELEVGRLVLAGAQTDECIRGTLHGAVARGYDAVLISDAHTTEDLSEFGAPTPDLVVAHTNLYWQYHQVPGRQAGVVTTDELDFTTL